MRRLIGGISCLLVVGLLIAMLQVKLEAERLEKELAGLEHAIAAEREKIQVLRAEWSYLNRPRRLEAMAAVLLPELRLVAPSRVSTFSGLPMRGGPAEATRTAGGAVREAVAQPASQAWPQKAPGSGALPGAASAARKEAR